LPADLQALLGDLPARVALQKLDYARQNLIATGNAGYSPDQLRGKVETVLDPGYGAVRSVSAGALSFPPLSPLVPPSAFDYR
jgi:lipase chaperone LimK